MKKGQSESLSFTIGLLLMFMLLLAIALFLYNVTKAQTDVRAEITLDKFIEHYVSCQQLAAQDCYCEPFSFKQLQKGNSVQLVNLASGEVSIQLRKDGLKDPVRTAKVKGDGFCTYTHDKEAQHFTKAEPATFAFSLEHNIGYKGTPSLALYKAGNMPCVVLPPDYLALLQKEKSCSFEKKSTKHEYVFLLNQRPGYEEELEYQYIDYNQYTSHMIESLAFSLNALGKVYVSAYESTALHRYAGKSISQQRGLLGFLFTDYEDNAKLIFEELYKDFNNSLTDQPLIIISLDSDQHYDYLPGDRASYREQGAFTIMHHSQSARGKNLTKFLEKELAAVSIVETRRPFIQIQSLEKGDDAEIADFMSYLKTSEDALAVPIIFLDILDRAGVNGALYKQPEPFVEAVKLALQNYLGNTTLTTKDSAPENNQNLFK